MEIFGIYIWKVMKGIGLVSKGYAKSKYIESSKIFRALPIDMLETARAQIETQQNRFFTQFFPNFQSNSHSRLFFRFLS